MLRFNVLKVMKAKGIQYPYAFLRRNGFTQRVASHLANGNVSMLKLDHIEKLCLLLLCEPHDLMVWYPDKETVYPENNPLEKLRDSANTDNLLQMMKNSTYQEVMEIMKELSERNS